MKAVIFEEHGDVDVMKVAEVPTPEPGYGEVRVRVRACALNHLDIWVRQGMPGIELPMPHILGNEPAGEIDAVGEGVDKGRIGERVLISPGINCGQCEFCVAGLDSACPDYQVVGFRRPGGYAQYNVVPGHHAIPVSDKLTPEEWSAIPLTFLTAWHMLFHHARMVPGETVLVMAAGSGVGAAAIQIVKMSGGTVITTASTEDKLRQARDLGADHTINYTDKSFRDEVKSITNGRGADIVIEHVGPAVWTDCMACLAKAGRLVTCGATTGPKVEIDLRFLFMRQLSVHGSYLGSRHELNRILQHVEEGKLRPVVDQVFPLEEARAAHQRMLDREQFGKIVLRVD